MQEQIEHALEVLDDLVHSHLRFAVHSVHKHDRNFPDRVVHVVSTHDDLHLEDIASAFHVLHNVVEGFSLVQTIATRQVTHARVEHKVSDKICNARSQFSLKVPTKNTASGNIARTSYHIIVMLLLLANEFGHVFGLKIIPDVSRNVMGQVGIHNKHVITMNQFHSIHICTSQTQFTSTLKNLDFVLSKDSLYNKDKWILDGYLQFNSYFIGSIGTVILNNDDFVTISTNWINL